MFFTKKNEKKFSKLTKHCVGKGLVYEKKFIRLSMLVFALSSERALTKHCVGGRK
jgi:hypothetical protein